MNRFVQFLQKIFLAKRGRPVALVILLWIALLSLLSERNDERAETQKSNSVAQQIETAIDFFSAPMTGGRQMLFDSYQRISPRVRTTQPVAIVEIDEYSLKEMGQWPWPRNRLASLIKAINAYEPLAIGLDMYMPEPDATSPAQVAANLPPANKALARQIASLPSHEALLAAEFFAAPTVLGAAGFDFQTYTSSTGLRTVPLATVGENPLPFVRQFPFVLASLPELQEAAQGQALLSVSLEDSIVRRMPLIMAVGDQLVPSLSMEMLRVATAEPAIRVTTNVNGVQSINVADLTVRTQHRGDVWLHFSRRDGSVSRQVSAAEVLAGNVDIDLLKGKLILVGLTGSGLSDSRTTPLGELVPGIEIQAQAIESFLEGRSLLRPWWMKPVELSLLLGIGLAMIYLVPQSRGRFAKLITTLPRATTWIVLGLNLLFVAVGHFIFRQTGFLFDAAALFVGFSSVLASLVASLLIEISKENERLAQDQQRLRDSANLVGGAIKTSLEKSGNQANDGTFERIEAYVSVLAVRLAGIPEFRDELTSESIKNLEKTIPLRDIGITTEIAEILKQPTILTDEQRTHMRRHSQIGALAADAAAKAMGTHAIEDSIERYLRCLHEVTESHHEWWNGNGYPSCIAGETIPLSARIAALIDVYDSLTHRRPHRPALYHAEAYAAIAKGRGTQFDPRIVDAFFEVADQFESIFLRHAEFTVA